MRLIDFIRGKWQICVTGTFCERIINITKEMGIYIQNVNFSSDNSITFTVSFKGAMKIFASPIPEGITLSVISRSGLPAILENRRKRYTLLLTPFLIFLLIFLSTHILWNVNIIDADPQTEEFLLEELAKLGVKKGRFTFLIDQSAVKNQMLIRHEHLQWIWVDIKGATALVRYTLRTPVPEIFDKSAPYNIVASRDGYITRVIATNGNAVVSPGDKVFQNQILIEGISQKSPDEKQFTHASGSVFAQTDFEKTVTIDKKEEIRTPTGNEIERLSVKFLNFKINLFINSSILYPKYDIIEYNRNMGFLPIQFTKQVIKEVDVSYRDNNIPLLINRFELETRKELEEDGKTVVYIEIDTSETNDTLTATARAVIEEDIAQERRITIGENTAITNN